MTGTIRLALLAGGLVFAGGAAAQTPGTLVPRTPPAAPPAAQGPGDVGDLVSDIVGWVVDQGLQAEIRQAMGERGADIAGQRRWLGDQGLLLDVRVARAVGDPGLPAHLRLVTIVDRGVGNTALETLTRDQERPRVLPGVPDGYRGSPEHSYLVWLKATGEPEVISHPFSGQLLRRAIEGSADRVLVAVLRQQGELDRIRALDLSLATAIPDLEGRAAAQRLAEGARKAREELARINAALSHELERERRAAAATQWLNTLGQGLSLAVQIGEIANRLGPDAPPTPLDIANEAALKEYVSTLHVRVTKDRTTIEQQRATIQRASDGTVTEFRNHLRKLNVPNSMLP